jgi:hypothetical protein
MSEICLLLFIVKKIDESLKFGLNEERSLKFVGLKVMKHSAI